MVITLNKQIISKLILLTMVIAAASCSSVRVTNESVVEEGVRGVTISKKAPETQAILANATVYFEYDSSRLTSKSIQTLRGLISVLQNNRSLNIVLEGHADERGTREYNLALGERRANAAKDYLMTYGISSDRITVLSYGKERPVDSGSNPLAWSKNRRSVTVDRKSTRLNSSHSSVSRMPSSA